METLVTRALTFATKAHDGQMRKYTGEHYIVHPIAVSALIRGIGLSEEAQAAALLHDTVEDTDVTLAEIETNFGYKVASMVFALTDVADATKNRATRKQETRARYMSIRRWAYEIHSIKVADLIDNTASIKAYDVNFYKVYRTEALLLIESLWHGDHRLLAKLKEVLV